MSEQDYQPTVDDFLKGRYCQYCGVKNTGDIPSLPWLCAEDDAKGELDQPRAMVEAYKRAHMMQGRPPAASTPLKSRWKGGRSSRYYEERSRKERNREDKVRAKNKKARKARRKNRS